MIPVTRSYLPDIKKLKSYIDRIYESGYLTNRGPLVQELEERLRSYLGVKHLILVANGSLALQLAYKALNLQGEVITTPFSFAATTSTLVWEGLKPVFADIDPQTFNLNPKNIEALITPQTSAIVPVHVFGNPCEVETIDAMAQKHGLKVVYDAAHAFGVQYKEKSVLTHGDISTLSFHATKLFHTIEGGAVITSDDELARKVRLLINFGITGPTSIEGLGTNAKMNEFEAAMGLCVLDDMEKIVQGRKEVWERYEKALNDKIGFQKFNPHGTRNYAYVPVLFKDEAELLRVQKALNEEDIFPRRYFYPSLDTLAYIDSLWPCKISKHIAESILCLPQFLDLNCFDQNKIISTLVDCIVYK
ncbi:MAG: DegT/DnrJ/EryC1/StrS family aminotransferase [Tenuifilaceae bacterium]|nr:DegT/DnrJ/EryC1/StrS family aminotransferase [Tenuifilaceae bacterium]